MTTPTHKALEALRVYLQAWDGGETSWFSKCYEAEAKAREALAALESELSQQAEVVKDAEIGRYLMSKIKKHLVDHNLWAGMLTTGTLRGATFEDAVYVAAIAQQAQKEQP